MGHVFCHTTVATATSYVPAARQLKWGKTVKSWVKDPIVQMRIPYHIAARKFQLTSSNENFPAHHRLVPCSRAFELGLCSSGLRHCLVVRKGASWETHGEWQ